MTNQTLPYDYAPALPMYKQGSMEKQAIIPILPLLALAFAGKSLWDIGRRDIPGMVGNMRRGDWGGAVRNLGSAGANALFALPGAGWLGRGLRMARAGKGMFTGMKTLEAAQAANKARALGKTTTQTAAQAPGFFGRMWTGATAPFRQAGKWVGSTPPVNYARSGLNRAGNAMEGGINRAMQSGIGTRMMPAVNRASAMYRAGPQWLMRPQGGKDILKLMGAYQGLSMGGDLAGRAMGSPGEGMLITPQQIGYPAARYGAIGNYFRNMPHTGPAEYML